MKEKEYVNWDFFWKRVDNHPIFLKFLYYVHLKQYYKILDKIKIKNPEVVELGAGIGKISNEIIKRYGGRSVLIDSSLAAYNMFLKRNPQKNNTLYIKDDIFTTEFNQTFDLVISDGLLEHFSNKQRVIDVHKKFVNKCGYILIFALNKNNFTRFLELGEKKMGYSEPIGFEECISLCNQNGLTVVEAEKYFFEYGVLCKIT